MPKPFRLRLNNMQFFSDGGAGDPGGTEPPGGGGTGAGEGGAGDPVTYTQEQLNAATQQQQADFLKGLGFENADQLKDTVNSWKEHQDSQKTEQDKLNDKLTTYETQLQEKDSTLSDLRMENTAIKAGITDEKNLAAVITLAKTKLSDDVDIAQAIEQVVTEFPHFKTVVEEEGPPKPRFGNGPQHKREPQSELNKWLEEFKK
ncbi:hypothetical protein [Bacillus mobilis]|uniref:hypothetical protein n=1 Tax=Bacillus mobilis TaxID=2026190 RepID=UPI0022E3DF7F|nr:hypothetical protein [Bacillus mobilis]